jgi:tRNA threonylcarbamoyladenosine biosynthesis protein TsaB
MSRVHLTHFPMLLLAVDTSGRQGSIALAECRVRENCAVIEVIPLAGGTFSADLVPQIAALLEKHGHSKSDLGALAAANGPGSFTGLRVGLAAIKGLAEALQIPVVAISLLEAVAYSGATRGSVRAALDAGRGDVYVGDYEFGLEERAYGERLVTREELLIEGSSVAAAGKVVVTPDPVLAEMVRARGLNSVLIEYPNSAVIARLGWQHLQRGETIRSEDLEANYLRRSDAEIFSKPAR